MKHFAARLAGCVYIGFLFFVACSKRDVKEIPNSEGILDRIEEMEKEARKTPPKVTTTNYCEEIEVAPNKWLVVHRKTTHESEKADWATHSLPRNTDFKEFDWFQVCWNEQTVTWEGTPIPICLREWEGNLYLIAFDRDNLDKSRLRYYQGDGASFREIAPSEFPKRIATQNMWIKDDELLILTRTLNVNEMTFQHTLTAKIWHQLGSGKDYEQSNKIYSKEGMEVLKEFKNKFEPIALPNIKKGE